MNPLTNVKNLQKLNQRELELGLTNKKSWHDKYKDSAWIFVGGLPYDLTEGDIVCVFSQYGEIVNINLVRDQKTGKSKGFCFICYEDQRSTVLSVDNLNGIKLLGRTLRVDHVEEYRKPKEHGDEDEVTKKIRAEGIAPRIPESTATRGTESAEGDDDRESRLEVKKEKVKKKKHKQEKETKKKKKQSSSDSESSDTSDAERQSKKQKVKVKKELLDKGYDKALNGSEKFNDNRKRDSDRRKRSVSPDNRRKRSMSPDERRKRSLSPEERQNYSSSSQNTSERYSNYRNDYADSNKMYRSETYRDRNSDRNWDNRSRENYQRETYESKQYRHNERNEYNRDYRDRNEGQNYRRGYGARQEYRGNSRRGMDYGRNNYDSQIYTDRQRDRDYDRRDRDGYRERR